MPRRKTGPLGMGVLPGIVFKGDQTPAKVKRLGRNEYEVTGLPDNEDAMVRRGDDGWTVDFFTSSIDDPDDAELRSEDYDSLREAMGAILPAGQKWKPGKN